MEKFTGEKAYSKYSTFSVGTESQKYKLTIGRYNGKAGKMQGYDKVHANFENGHVIFSNSMFFVGDSLASILNKRTRPRQLWWQLCQNASCRLVVSRMFSCQPKWNVSENGLKPNRVSAGIFLEKNIVS